MSDPDARLRRLQEQAALVLAGDGFDADPTAAATIAELIEQLVIHQTELRIQNAELEAAQATASAALARYAALFDSLPLPAVVLDREAVVRIANPAAADLFDRPGPSDVEGLALLGRLDAAARPRFLATLASSGQGPARVSDVGLLVDHVPTAAGLGDPVPHDVYLLALRGEAVDHRSLALFVDRASDAEAARLAEVDAALLELRRAAHDASPSALRVAAVRQLERLSGCERCAWFLVQDDAPEPELLAWSPTVSRSVMTAPAVLDAVGRALAAATASPVPAPARGRRLR
ncbi:MAG: PAS domain-containing protein [Kineosporiaceae bacterium]